jgi:glutaredoxin-related protein
MSEEKVKAVEAEVQRLQDAKVIREVKIQSSWPTLYQ